MSWVNWHFKIWLCFPNRHFCFCHDNSTCIRFKENGLLLNTARRHYCTAPWWSVFDKPNSVCLKPHVFFQRTSMWFWILLCFYFCRFVLIQCLFFNASFSTFAVRFVFPICVSIFSFFQKLYIYIYISIYIYMYIYVYTNAHAVSYICICTYTYRHRWIWTKFMFWHLQPFCGHTHWSHQKLLCIFDSIGDQIRSCYIKNVR